MKFLSTFVFTTFALLAASASHACDLCAIYNVNDLHGAAPDWRFGIAEQFTHFATLQNEGREIRNDADQRLDSSITQMLLGYNFNDRFSLQVSVPFIHREFHRPEETRLRHGEAEGLGDVSLIGSYVLVRQETEKRSVVWTISGGLKLPTGSTGRLEEETREGHHEVHEHGESAHEELPESGIHGHDLTLGSGSWDGVVGTNLYVRSQRLFFTGAVQYSLRSEGDFDYRFANDLVWSGGPGFYLALHERYTVALAANCSGEHKARDQFGGARAEDTGLTAVYLGPALSVTWADRVSVELGADLPLEIDNTATQIVPDYRLRAAVSVRF